MSDTARELAVLREYMERDEWVRLNGNTWAKGVHTVRTGYVFGEATVTVGCGASGELMTTYRGPHPLVWVVESLSKVKGMDFAKRLANQMSNE